MWELNYKESWVLKNECFWTMELEKTLERPLDCKIKLVHLKGNQSWVCIGKTDAEAETPILWPLMWRTDSLEKTLILGKIEGERRRGRQRMRRLFGIPDSMDVGLNKFRELVMPYNHLILCRPLLLLSVFPSIKVFSSESVLYIKWPKCWSFSIRPSNECSGLISLRIDWFDLLAVQGPLKSLLQHHSSKASVLWHSAFFMVQLSHPYMTTRKTVALTRWRFVGK